MTEFGSPPHHDRVLAVVLVMPEGVPDPDVRVVHVEPNSPHGEAFWQDAGRPWCGQTKSAKATSSDECVLRACPTHGETYMLGPYADGQRVCSFGRCPWGWHDAPDPVPGPALSLGGALDLAHRCN